MSRSEEEILDDVYYKGFITKWLTLTEEGLDPAVVSEEIGKYRDAQVKNDPDREERINECLEELVNTVLDATKMLKVKQDAEDEKKVAKSKRRKKK